jgi:hypothetical protein
MQEARATDAVDHLQAAALELIEAARAFLDVLEELVADRERFGEATDVVGAAAAVAARIAGFASPPLAPDRDGAGAGPAGTGDPATGDPTRGAPTTGASGPIASSPAPPPPVERIPVA